MKRLTIGLAALTLALAGCGGGGDKADAAKEAAGDAGAAAADAGAAAGDAGAAAAGGSTTGVAECDDYLGKIKACIDSKVPEAQRAAVQAGIDASKKSWDAITDKGALASACKMAMDQAKTAYSAMGCTF